MASRLNVILRRGKEVRYSFQLHEANVLPSMLAYGPDAAWIALEEHQKRAAVITVTDGRLSRQRAVWAGGIGMLFEAGDEGGVLIDWDDKVLWYFTDYEGEKEGIWGAWFASWLEVFWPGWRIFRPQAESCAGILQVIGHPATLAWHANAADATAYNAYLKQFKDDPVHYRTPPEGHPRHNSMTGSLIGVVKQGRLRLFLPGSRTEIEAILAKGPDSLPDDSQGLDLKECPEIVPHTSADLLIDTDRKRVYASLFQILPNTDAPCWDIWPGWGMLKDQQGFPVWAGHCGLTLPAGLAFKRFVIRALGDLAGGGLSFRPVLDALIRAGLDAGAALPDGDKQDFGWEQRFLRGSLERRALHYFASCRDPGEAMARDRRHPAGAFECRNPESWSPDLTVYAWPSLSEQAGQQAPGHSLVRILSNFVKWCSGKRQ